MNRLWLCLRFKRLPLEVFIPADRAGPAISVEQQRVVSANEAAVSLGVEAGMRLSGALGLAPGLSAFERDVQRETDALYRLACWASGFSPQLSQDAGDELLIEIGGCLRLFGGLQALCMRMHAEVIAQGFSVAMALAPTPRAAQWLARAGCEGACVDMADVQASLASLHVEVMGLTQGEREDIAALGVRTLAGLFALPRAGLARRFGSVLPHRLAQALGEIPDLREPFVPPETFEQKLELPAKVALAGMLLFAARRLLASLAGWLGSRAAGVASCTLVLIHDDGIAPERLVLSFASATRDLARMERVLRERLERHELSADVSWLVLEAAVPVLLPGSTPGLFAPGTVQTLAPVIERLRARLGKDAVHGLAVRQDHRPECATRVASEGEDCVARSGSPRPFWLLQKPRALQMREGTLHYGGAVQRIAGPERIESGWWSEPANTEDEESDEGDDEKENVHAGPLSEDVRRDYYVAVSEAGEWLWIFQDKAGWWLHGVFA